MRYQVIQMSATTCYVYDTWLKLKLNETPMSEDSAWGVAALLNDRPVSLPAAGYTHL